MSADDYLVEYTFLFIYDYFFVEAVIHVTVSEFIIIIIISNKHTLLSQSPYQSSPKMSLTTKAPVYLDDPQSLSRVVASAALSHGLFELAPIIRLSVL